MVLVKIMKYAPHTHANDNLPILIRHPRLATPGRSRYEKQDEEGAEDSDAERKKEEKRKAHRDYVYRRLCELAAFEARARGVRRRP